MLKPYFLPTFDLFLACFPDLQETLLLTYFSRISIFWGGVLRLVADSLLHKSISPFGFSSPVLLSFFRQIWAIYFDVRQCGTIVCPKYLVAL